MARLGRRQQFSPKVLRQLPDGIQFNAASNSGYQTLGSSYSWAHVNAGNYLCVGISLLSLVGVEVQSVTYGGVNLTFKGAQASATGSIRVEYWDLTTAGGLLTGSNTVEVTFTGSIGSGASAAGAISLQGVHQTSPTEELSGATATNGISPADATVDVNTAADKDWCIDVVGTDDTAITVGAGQTQRSNVTGTLGSGAMSTEGPKTPSGAVTMSWTNVGALATWSIVSIGIRPLAAASLVPAYRQLTLLGVGA